jgi:hypothetical protein
MKSLKNADLVFFEKGDLGYLTSYGLFVLGDFRDEKGL